MFASTITLTVSGNARILNRVNQDSYGSEYNYSGADESIVMKIRHSVDSVDGDGLVMKRHNVFVEHIVYPTPTASQKKSTATITLRHAKFDDPQDSAAIYNAAAAFLATGTNAADLAAGVN